MKKTFFWIFFKSSFQGMICPLHIVWVILGQKQFFSTWCTTVWTLDVPPVGHQLTPLTRLKKMLKNVFFPASTFKTFFSTKKTFKTSTFFSAAHLYRREPRRDSPEKYILYARSLHDTGPKRSFGPLIPNVISLRNVDYILLGTVPSGLSSDSSDVS